MLNEFRIRVVMSSLNPTDKPQRKEAEFQVRAEDAGMDLVQEALMMTTLLLELSLCSAAQVHRVCVQELMK